MKKFLFLAGTFAFFSACSSGPQTDPSADYDNAMAAEAATKKAEAPVEAPTPPPPVITSRDWIKTIKKGKGRAIKSGQLATVHYTGRLLSGKKFDSSRDRKKPFSFHLGTGEVIQGWDVGIEGMRVGEKRKLTVPPELGYGAQGGGNGLIPPNSTLVFDVELLKID